MGVDGAAVTSAEAAQYRAAGWWSDTTLSDCVAATPRPRPTSRRTSTSRSDPPDRQLTWSEFDHAATNLAHRAARARGHGPATA